MKKSDKDEARWKPATRLVRGGRGRDLTGPFVNPPVVHASTVLFDSVDEMIARKSRYLYGRWGTPTLEAMEQAVSDLEGAAGTILSPSGLAAISTALLSCLSAGDHLLMVDCAYYPTRNLAGTVLKRFGVETTYFDPAIGGRIREHFTSRTRAVYLEVPGSLTFEMQDLPAIADAAHEGGATVLTDNTWATPLYYKPLKLGADIVVHAGTKYFGGHSDIMLGTASATAATWPNLVQTHRTLGLTVGPDDAFLGLRGLRTLGIRLERQMASALKVAAWLADRPEVGRVLHPALPEDPGHALWKRDMTGASGLFAFTLAAWGDDEAKRLIDGLELFGIGASWGGYESLATLASKGLTRTVHPWPAGRPLIRVHIGLEDPDDLIADLAASFERVAAG
ncbi:MAG: cystathionine beta-lyase [Rhizobiales bacterium]|nr:cystathionine beta-lyase [Hyphomicrobiales bacterium]MBN9009317.1 cystathionine beta-lyase [Hyphomicrobiales bacterium]